MNHPSQPRDFRSRVSFLWIESLSIVRQASSMISSWSAAGSGRRGPRFSEHGYDELSADAIFAREVIVGIADAIPVRGLPGISEGSVCPNRLLKNQ